MEWIYSDGGRSKYFKATNVSDCVVRAICNATGMDYKVVYDAINELAKKEHKSKRVRKSSARDGVRKATDKKYIESLGWKYISTCKFGQGVTMHLVPEELPDGTLIVQISKHLTCVKDKVIYDTYDCSRKEWYDQEGNLQVNTRRAVYGYWVKKETKDTVSSNKQFMLPDMGNEVAVGATDQSANQTGQNNSK